MARWFVALAMSGILIALILNLYFFNQLPFGTDQNTDLTLDDENVEKLSKTILIAVSDIQQMWTKGDYKKEIDFAHSNCPELSKNVQPEFLKCNPHFLQCYYNGLLKTFSKDRPFTSNEVQLESKEVVLVRHISSPSIFDRKHDRVYEAIGRGQNQGEFVVPSGIKMEIEMKDIGIRYSFVLENLCHQTYLPEQVYDYGQTMDHLKKKISPENYQSLTKQTFVETPRIWDNIGKFMTIDKYLVTVQDFNHYLWHLGLEHRINLEVDKWQNPVSGISMEEMKSFCSSRGKRLLTAPLYDASVFYRKKNDTDIHHELISRNFLAPELPENNKTKKETASSTLPFSMSSASWMGTFQWRSDFMEAVDNPWATAFNLSTFSSLWPNKHSWDHLSYRTAWNGRESGSQEVSMQNSVWGDLNLFSRDPIDFKVVPIAFRCYQEWGEYY